MRYFYKVHSFYGGTSTGEYILQNGVDVRRFREEGIKEISKEDYDRIVEDDKRIVASRNEKSKKLIAKYLPKDFENSWHRPFCAKNLSEFLEFIKVQN